MKRNLRALPEQAVLSAAVVTPAAVQQAALKWRRYAPEKSKGLLEARRSLGAAKVVGLADEEVETQTDISGVIE